MARPHLTPRLDPTEEAITVLFCLVDDAHACLNPEGEGLKRLSDSEVLALALARQLRGVESQRSFPRDAERFFSDPFPGVLGLAPSSFHRRPRGPRRFLEPLRRAAAGELVGDPETLVVDSTLLSVPHPRRVKQSHEGWGRPASGAAWARWGSFAVYGVKLHLLCSPNRVPLSHELTPANLADVLLVEELSEVAGLDEGRVARGLFGDLAHRGAKLKESLAKGGTLPAAERGDRRPGVGRQVEIAFAILKREFRLGETLARTLVGLATRIAAKPRAYALALRVNRALGRPQGRMKELWA